MAAEQIRKQSSAGTRAGIYIALVVVLLGTAGFWYFRSAAERRARALELTPEAKAYVQHLRLTDVGIKATESYLKQLVVEIEGKIANVGGRPLESVELYCLFHDSSGQVVLRERVAIVSQRNGGLKPQQMKPFRLPFDNLPDSWNHQSPQLVIAGIRFTG